MGCKLILHSTGTDSCRVQASIRIRFSLHQCSLSLSDSKPKQTLKHVPPPDLPTASPKC